MKLIDKDALVAEIEKRREESWVGHYTKEKGIVFDITDKILSFIDTLEVKEVDLEKEHKDWLHQHFDGRRDHNASGDYLQRSSQLDMAKHFFKLGLNASNPLTWEDVKLIWNIGDEIPYMPEEDFFKELLQRYKAQKGEKV